MGILLGPFDPLLLIINTINELMRKGVLTVDEARRILRSSMDPNMPDAEKERILNDMIRRG